MNRERLQPYRFRKFGLFLLILSFVFAKPLLTVLTRAISSELHSHILLIPFVAAYLVYLRRDDMRLPSRTSGTAILSPLLCGLVALVLAFVLPHFSASAGPDDQLALTIFAFVCLVITGGLLFSD